MIEIAPVVSWRDRRRFIQFPYTLYRGDPHWVPPLRLLEWDRFSRRNPFFEHADMARFLALSRGVVVGRVAAIDDRLHNQVHRDNIATVGCFEAKDADAAHALLEAAEGWARARGRQAIRGPLDLSLNESSGLLVDGYDEDPMILMPYHPPAYRQYLEAAGYRKIKDLYAWILNRRAIEPREAELIDRVRRRLRVTIREMNVRHVDRELTSMLEIYAEAWKDNWGFVPPTAREARHTVGFLRHLIDPRLVLTAEVDGRAVGFVAAVPDINQALKGTAGRLFPRGLVQLMARKRLITQLRLLLLGVVPEYRGTGLYPLLIASLHEPAERFGWRRVEFSWVLEDNADVNNGASALGARLYKTYRVYQKPL
jgi:GNAT superfamily N-acetyltransferase